MKEAVTLVLSGGGAKGMYHIGVWEALVELDFEIQALIGNSVGALVAGFIAQGDMDIAHSVLKDLNVGKVVDIPKEFVDKGKFNLNENNLKKLTKLQQSIFQKKGLDTTPLRKLLEENLSEKKIRKSGIDIGVATYQINKMKAREIFIEDIPEGELISYLMASATIPGFKVTKIGDDSFIDGGVYNNIPLNMARDRGYRNIIVIDIAGIGMTKKLEVEDITITYIKNKSQLGGMLDFDKEAMQGLRDLGYRDTLRVFGKLHGVSYYLNPGDKTYKGLLKQYQNDGLSNIPDDIWRDSDHKDSSALMLRIQRSLPREYAKHRDWLLVMAECTAICLNIDRNKIYSWDELIKQIKKVFDQTEKEVEETLVSLNERSAGSWIKKGLELTVEFQKKQRQKLMFYFLIAKGIRRDYPLLPVSQIENSNPEINPARLFLGMLLDRII